MTISSLLRMVHIRLQLFFVQIDHGQTKAVQTRQKRNTVHNLRDLAFAPSDTSAKTGNVGSRGHKALKPFSVTAAVVSGLLVTQTNLG
jgi:hypothetical protein